jgi:hypothetical protein
VDRFQTDIAAERQKVKCRMAKDKGPPLSSVNKQLIEEADILYSQINDSWQTVEAHIQDSGVLKPVVIGMGHDEDGDSFFLGVQKINGKWRICTGMIPHNAPDDAEVHKWIPVGDSPIQERIFYFSRIQDLYAEVVRSNEEVVAKLRAAVLNADDSLRSLGLK